MSESDCSHPAQQLLRSGFRRLAAGSRLVPAALPEAAARQAWAGRCSVSSMIVLTGSSCMVSHRRLLAAVIWYHTDGCWQQLHGITQTAAGSRLLPLAWPWAAGGQPLTGGCLPHLLSRGHLCPLSSCPPYVPSHSLAPMSPGSHEHTK